MPMSPRLLRPRASGDPDAGRYIAAVQTADGQALEPAVKKAINDFVVGCKADGIWSAIKASCILMGARTLSGALTPLVGGTITNNNFVTADYNRETGLKGNASSKTLVTSLLASSLSSSSHHILVGGSDFETALSNRNVCGVFAGSLSSLVDLLLSALTPTRREARSGGGTGARITSGINSSGTVAMSRTNSTVISVYQNGVFGASENVSAPTLPSVAFAVFGRNDNGSISERSSARLTFFSIGDGLTESQLLLMHNRVTTLETAIGTAIP